MKKGKIITASLLAAMMTIGAGYAAWTDKVKINNTVTTGEMNVHFVEQDSPKYPYINSYDGTTKNYVKTDIPVKEARTMSVTVENLYPGSQAYYHALILNEGTIPAVVKNVKVSLKSDKQLNKKLWVYGGYSLKDENDNYIKGNHFWCRLNELEGKLNEMLIDVQMEPGQKISFDIPDEYKDEINKQFPIYDKESDNCIYLYLPDTVENKDKVEKTSASFDITVNFKQHNVQ